MRTDHVYLRSNTLLEPLIDQWYTWTHLIPPATCARNLTERHLKIMESYIAAPLSGSNYAQAMEIVNELNCKEVFVYAMGTGAVAQLCDEH